jgi:hypothetical protein
MLMRRSFKLVESLMSMWEITWSKSAYAKCVSIHDVCRAFNKMPSQNMVTLNVMVCGCVKCRHWNYFDKYKWKLVCSQTS